MELANCKRDLAHARAQLIQAWFGARAVENAPMNDSVDPMQLVVTDEVFVQLNSFVGKTRYSLVV